jgi:serine phosphatase RsbU (regulator of sigma subunit)
MPGGPWPYVVPSPQPARSQRAVHGPGSGGERWGTADDGGKTAPRLSSAMRLGALLLPPLLIVAGVLLNVLTRDGLAGTPLFAAAPLAAAPFYRVRATILLSLVAVGALAGVRVQHIGGAGLVDVTRTVTVVVVSVLAAGIGLLLRRRGAALASARGVAEAAQLAVLPVPPSRVGGLQVAARYKAAQVGARIGGDFYAVQETPHGTRLIVGDVRGKGMDAIEAVVVIVGAFREAAEQETTLEAVAERLERALHREGLRRRGMDDHEDFTTALLAELAAENRELLRLVNRGHPPPLLLYDGRRRYCDPKVPALPLGMAELGRWPDRADEMPFPLGAQLLLYTDGLSEARDSRGTFFDPLDKLARRSFTGPEALLDAVMASVDAHTGGATADDMALLAVQRRDHTD